jgi:hypothetical protein
VKKHEKRSFYSFIDSFLVFFLGPQKRMERFEEERRMKVLGNDLENR